MHRILIVDDEPRHRIGFSNMIKRLRPDYVVSEARNGADALKLASENPIDIMFTDIKMPVMDGLELIEQLGEMVKDIKVIILSAFGYFEYAQKAIGLGAFGYLLKPVDENKVVEMLVKVENKIEKEQMDKLEKVNLKKQLENTLPIYLELQLNKWIKGILSKTELNGIESVFPLKGSGTVLVSFVENFRELTVGYSSEELKEIQTNIKYWIKEALNYLGYSTSFFLQENEILLVTILNTSAHIDFRLPEVRKRLNDLINDLEIGYGFKVIVGVGNSHHDIIDEIRQAYEEACMALENKFYINDNKTIIYSELPKGYHKLVPDKFKDEEELAEAVRDGDTQRVDITLEAVFQRVTEGGYPPVGHLQEYFSHILLGILKGVRELTGEEKYEEYLYQMPNQIRKFQNYDAFKEGILEILYSVIDSMRTFKDKKGDILFGKCLEYIEKHYSENISLETLAEEFHFNPSYFSYLFKNKTGMNFSQYLIGIRLMKGKELLEKSSRKVYEISQMVGYRDPKYFNRVFKKAFGITPEDYRRK